MSDHERALLAAKHVPMSLDSLQIIAGRGLEPDHESTRSYVLETLR